MRKTILAAAMAAALGAASCADDGGAAATTDAADTTTADTAADTTADTTADSGTDTGPVPDAAPDAGPDAAPDAGPDAVTPGLAIDEADEAPVTATVDFERAVSASVAAGPYVFLLYADKDVDVLDLTDAEEPQKYGPITTAGPVLAVAYDEANQLAYLADATGDVQAVDLTALEAPVMAGKLSIPTLGKDSVKLARVGDQLFVASGAMLQPLGIKKNGANVTLALKAPVVLPAPVTTLAAGGGALFIGDDAGKVTSWARGEGEAFVSGASITVGGTLRGIVAKGSRILVASQGKGLSVVDFAGAQPAVVFETDEVSDVTDIALFGRTVVVSLEREAVATIDVSDFAAPRVVSTNKGSRPDWIAVSRGTLFFGGANSGDAASVRPFVSARIPEKSREAFPRRRVIPVTLSKAVDPATVTSETVRLTCGGQPVEGVATLDPSQTTVRFRPLSVLPAAAECALTLVGVTDNQGQAVASATDAPAATFTTATQEDAPVVNPASKYPHTADGGFTDWTQGGAGEHEWFDVTPAKGVYTYFYADFDGESLWILNDWFYNGDDIDPDCYNQFYVYTGGGAESWDIRAFGDQRVEVRKNGELVDPEAEEVQGGASYGPSPNVEEPHTMYEIRLPASPGAFTVQLHDPGPSFACATLEQEPTPIVGDLASDGGGITTTIETPPVEAPLAAVLTEPIDGAHVMAPVPLSWVVGADFVGTTMLELQVSTNEAFEGKLVANALTYGSSYLLPAKLVTDGTTYYWRVIAWTPAGSEASETWSFTIGDDEPQGPIAVDDTASTTAGVAIDIPVLANDEGIELRVVEATQGQGGTTEIGLGVVTYTPSQGFVGEDTFTYTIWDKNELTDSATVVVTVTAGGDLGFSLYGGVLPTVGSPNSAVVGDFDGNGRVDFAVGDVNGPNIGVFPSNATGGVGFGERIDLVVPGVEANVQALAAGDLNGDGRPDIASVSQWSGTMTVFLGTPGNEEPFSAGMNFPTQPGPSAVAISDIDGDGVSDIIVASASGVSVYVNGSADQLELILQPAVTFQACAGTMHYLAVADLNLDERNDVAVVCDKGGLALLANHTVEGEVVLTSVGSQTLSTPNGIAAADLDGDGRKELAISTGAEGGAVYVLPNFTEGGSDLIIMGQPMTVEVGSETRGVAVAQLVGSELPDLVVPRGNAGAVSVLENLTVPGSIAFGAPVSFEVDGLPVAAAPADLDKNGLMDLVVVDGLAKAVKILVNNALSE